MSEIKVTMRAARVNAGLTQRQVAAALNVDKGTVCSWENGKTSPAVDMAIAFCELCNVPFDSVTFLRQRNAIK